MNSIDDISSYDIQPTKKQCLESNDNNIIKDEQNIKIKNISQKSKFYDDLEEMMYGFGIRIFIIFQIIWILIEHEYDNIIIYLWDNYIWCIYNN